MLYRISEDAPLAETIPTEAITLLLDVTTVDVPPLPALEPWRRFWRSLPWAHGFGNYMVMDPSGLRCYGASDWEMPMLIGTRIGPPMSSITTKLREWIGRHRRWRSAEIDEDATALAQLQREMEADNHAAAVFMSDPRIATTIALTCDSPLPFEELRQQMGSAEEVELILGAAGKKELVAHLKDYVAPDAPRLAGEAAQLLVAAWRGNISIMLSSKTPRVASQQSDPVSWDPETDALPPFSKRRAAILLSALTQAS